MIKLINITLLLSLAIMSVGIGGSAFALEDKENPLYVIQDIRCSGNQSTSCEFIANRIYLKRNETVTEKNLRNAKLRLSALPYYESTRLYLEKGEQRGHVIVVIDVIETSNYETYVSAQMNSTGDEVSHHLYGELSIRNLISEGDIIDIGVSHSAITNGDMYQLNINYTDPQLFNLEKYYWQAGLSFTHAEHDGDVFDEHDTCISCSLNFDFSLGRRFADFSYIELRYGYTKNLDGEDLFRDNNHRLSLRYGWDSEDDPLFTTTGSKFSLFVPVASRTKDQFEYDIDLIRLNFRKTWGLSSEWHLKAIFTAAAYTDPEYEAGGTSIRLSRNIHLPWSKRGRWYIGGSVYGNTLNNDHFSSATWGILLETKRFGTLNLALSITD